ncbi:reverse transcriptase domain-containing protein [Rubellimicrobium aerolatum]|uniref:Reverse transcriptase domain-containing protein n=1 Tax=Rubellimicrobium aerolatum TaxID=490979 RepID=A0ABW0SEM3_9RHOB|nr:reverse transcriptase domain-containing protein [Rubellimicrobium aerolatum]MBP1806880.1 hypothetical protein [Rubellimicrobium aerolatum]
MRSLFEDVRGEENIFAAWRHVKRSALNSGSAEIKGMASEFEHTHQRQLRRIITQLREGRFTFDPVEGVLKDKQKRLAQGKDPRPIAIATLKNRVVQRAILQVLQPRESRDLRDPEARYETKLDSRLGRINDVNRSSYGVGGLIYPYGGVRPAIATIMQEIDAGAKFFYQSDIKSFFTKIPTAQVVDFVLHETGDRLLADLFSRGLEVHLRNKEELKGYAALFPDGGIGVAQGSSLSAFAGNVLLFELDHELNDMGVRAVRYIDDILMVSRNEATLDAAVLHAESKLKNFGFGLYSPIDSPDKAARGKCSSAINFLGCTLQPKRCTPSTASVRRIKSDVVSGLSESKSAIKEAIRKGIPPSTKQSQSATLDAMSKKVYGWQKSFSFCNDGRVFEQLDHFIAQQVLDYHGFICRNIAKLDIIAQMGILGVPSTKRMFQKSGGMSGST